MHQKTKGITLTELLIALGIVALIAVFAIPKVLDTLTGNDATASKRKAQEVARILTAAYAEYRANERPTDQTEFEDLLPYMHYLKADTSSVIDDDPPNNATKDCASAPCIKFLNGAVGYYANNTRFGSTDTTAAFFLHLDPDGAANEPGSDGPGKAVAFWLFYDGKVLTRETIPAGTCSSVTCYAPGQDPAYFSWD